MAVRVSTWQQRVRRIFLLQLALVCAVVACGLLVLAWYGADSRSWLPPTVFLAATLLMLAIIWAGDRAARNAIAPVCWILREVRTWDPQRPNPDALAPEHLPDGIRDDVRTLADALHGFGLRLREHAAREREFTRAASHELRTPLTVIRVASDLIGHDEALSEASRRSLERIRSASAGMEAIIDALLLLARSEEVNPEAEEFAVAEVLEQELQRIQPMAEGKGLTLRVQRDAEPVLHAPPQLLRIVLGRLLDNAIRYTHDGEVLVRLTADRLQIEDSGVGMDATTLERAIEPFYCGSGPCDATGPGLGLAIAHRVAERCGWALELESVAGHGTRASVVFRPVA
ncbi:MAG: HAMP domain-containing histidine kinase [Proteobacteria bacterium]|nr:HAMP domain-containing histidine kinase [Pseudomonadota bacterium]